MPLSKWELCEYDVIIAGVVSTEIVIVFAGSVVELRVSEVEVGIEALCELEGVIIRNVRDLDVIGHSYRVVVAVSVDRKGFIEVVLIRLMVERVLTGSVYENFLKSGCFVESNNLGSGLLGCV